MDQMYGISYERFPLYSFVKGECSPFRDQIARGAVCLEVGTSNHLFLVVPDLDEKLDTWLEESSEMWSIIMPGILPRTSTRDHRWGGLGSCGRIIPI